MNLLVRSFLTAIVPLLLFAFLIGIVLLKVVFPAVEASVFQMAQDKQRSTKAQVTDFIESRRNILESLARRKSMTQGPSQTALAFLKSEQDQMTDLFEGLYYNELNGTVTPADGPKFSVADRPYFPRVVEGQTVVGEVLTSRATDRRILLMVVPVRTSDGEVVAALGGTVLVSELFRSIRPTREPFDLQVALLQDQAVIEGFPEAAQVARDPATFSLQGSRITSSKGDFRAWSCELPEVPWQLVLAWPERRMLAQLHQALTASAFCLLAIFILASGLSIWLLNSIARPLQRAAQTLEQYRGDSVVELQTDAPRELSVLLHSINKMSERVSHEMARRMELEQQLAKAVHQERLGTLADSIAHDFSNVLAAVINLAEFCQEEAEKGTQLYEDLETIVGSANMGVTLVRQLREKAMSTEHPTEELVFDTEFEKWEETFKSLLPLRLTLRTQLDAENVSIRAIPHHLFQVLLNLICNARDALINQKTGEITLHSFREKNRLLIEVSDNGPGVPPEVADRIFEPFFTTRGEDGSGLGLSTCHRLISVMDAEIELIQEGSTCFRITFPVSTT